MNNREVQPKPKKKTHLKTERENTKGFKPLTTLQQAHSVFILNLYAFIHFEVNK